MRTRKVIVLSLLSTGAAFLFSGCPAQPPGPCVIARAAGGPFSGAGNDYVVHYYMQSTTGDCATDPNIAAQVATPASTNGDFTGGIFAEAYGQVTAINKHTAIVPAEFGWTSTFGNFNDNLDYVECSPLNAEIYAAEGIGGGADGGACVDDPLNYGAFTTDTEDSNNTCTIAGSDAGTQVVSGVLVTYYFPSILVYTNAAAGEGTQIQATNVTITRQSLTVPGPACVRTYTAIGLWPAALCNVDNDCNAVPQPNNTPPRPLGSGILTNIPVSCGLDIPSLDPVITPNGPYIELTAGFGGGEGGGDKDNNGTNGTGVCFFTGASPTVFPYTD